MAKILIVDDDPALRELLKDMLEFDQHEVVMAETGMEALTKLRSGRFQLAILDFDMPLLNGRETLKLVRRDPNLFKLPVLMCTGHGKLSEIDEAFEDGANGYVVKPFDWPTLQKTVIKALSKSI